MKKVILMIGLTFAVTSAQAEYLGCLSSNPYLECSVSNPYGHYGNPYNGDSINNPYGRYGNRYSNDSPNNPYATNPPGISSDGSIYGGE